MNKPRPLDEWKEIVMTARASGLSDKAWCDEHDININSFYSSIKRLRKNACQIPKPSKPRKKPSQPVVELEIIEANGDGAASDTVFEMDPVPSPELLPKFTVHDDSEDSRVLMPASMINISCSGLQIEIKDNASESIVRAAINAIGGIKC